MSYTQTVRLCLSNWITHLLAADPLLKPRRGRPKTYGIKMTPDAILDLPVTEVKLTLNEDEMKAKKGFSLIELLVAVAIVGILAAVAIPSYQSYVVKSNRAAAQSFMMDLANREKQYMLDARTYANYSTLGVLPPADVSKHYTFTIATVGTPPSFTITATPFSSQQASDGPLTLGSDGDKDPDDKW